MAGEDLEASFEDLTAKSFDEISNFAAANVSILLHILCVIERLAQVRVDVIDHAVDAGDVAVAGIGHAGAFCAALDLE